MSTTPSYLLIFLSTPSPLEWGFEGGKDEIKVPVPPKKYSAIHLIVFVFPSCELINLRA